MKVKKTRQDEIKRTIQCIKDMKDYAVMQMIDDMAQSFENNDEIVVFSESHCNVIMVSCINGNLKFVFENGTFVCPITEKFDGNEYELVFCVWTAFFNELKIE